MMKSESTVLRSSAQLIHCSCQYDRSLFWIVKIPWKIYKTPLTLLHVARLKTWLTGVRPAVDLRGWARDRIYDQIPLKIWYRWFKVCWFRICNKKYTKPCSFLREKCYKKYIFSLKNTQFAIEMNGEQPSNSTFWRSSSKTNSLTTPDFFICSSLYWILQNTKRKK